MFKLFGHQSQPAQPSFDPTKPDQNYLNNVKKLVDPKLVRLDFIINSMSDGVIVTDEQGTVTIINPSAGSLSGWGIEDSIGLSVYRILPLTNELGQAILDTDHPCAKSLRTKTLQSSSDLRLLPKAGSSMLIDIKSTPLIENDELEGQVIIFRDISTLEAQQKERADFISTASHEMRTPVAAIEGYLSLALNPKVAAIDDKARVYLDKAYASTKALGKLFADLLTAAKSEDGRVVNHPEVIELGEYIANFVDANRERVNQRGLVLSYAVAANQSGYANKTIRPLYYCHVDPGRISEVLNILLENAVKYTPKGQITIGIDNDASSLRFWVSDTGLGIPEGDIDHLFQKFYRVDNRDTRTIGGTGLGLFIAKKIVELYEGRIWVESKLGEGSTFFVKLPRLDTNEAMHLQSNPGLLVTPISKQT